MWPPLEHNWSFCRSTSPPAGAQRPRPLGSRTCTHRDETTGGGRLKSEPILWRVVVVRLLFQLSSGVVMQEVLHEGNSGAQTLQHGVQVAGVARVVQSAHSQHARRLKQPLTAITSLPPDRARRRQRCWNHLQSICTLNCTMY